MESKTMAAPAKSENVTLNIVNTKTDELAESFGISEQRRDEMCELVVETMENHGESITDDMVKISSKLHNHNELAWAMFMYGTHLSEQQGNPLASLAALLQRSGRN